MPSDLVGVNALTDGIERADGEGQLVLRRAVSTEAKADAYLVVVRSSMSGRIDFPSKWRTSGVEVVSATRGPSKSARKLKAKKPTGLTGREYQVLRILNSHGWCTTEMVRLIAQTHGIFWTERACRVGVLLRRLRQLDLIIGRKVGIGTNAIAYATTDRGIRYIRADGDALLCDTNAIKDPANVYHFLELNRIMLQFQSGFKTNYWLSDFEVRSDNSFIGEKGFAKDYDSVVEIILPTGTVRFAIEYGIYSIICGSKKSGSWHGFHQKGDGNICLEF
jgi:hypothetical protein